MMANNDLLLSLLPPIPPMNRVYKYGQAIMVNVTTSLYFYLFQMGQQSWRPTKVSCCLCIKMNQQLWWLLAQIFAAFHPRQSSNYNGNSHNSHNSFVASCSKWPSNYDDNSNNSHNLLLPPVQDSPAVTVATHANFTLQLIVAFTQRALIKLIVNFIPAFEGELTFLDILRDSRSTIL